MFDEEENLAHSPLHGNLNDHETVILAERAKALPLNQFQKMPDVRGMLASDAVAEVIRAGYKVKIVGKGRVKTQVLDNQTGTIKLYLDP